MSRWYKAQMKQCDSRVTSLTLAARGVLMMLEELLSTHGTLRGNVSQIAHWASADRKNTRLALEAIAASGYLDITVEDLGKAGTFYTIQTPSRTEATPKQTPSSTQADPKHVPDKSGNDAGYEGASLYRVEEKREEETTTPQPPKGGREPVGDPLTGKLSPGNLFDGEFEILEGAFLSRKISAFWQLHGEKRQDITDWLDASKETRKTAFEWALGESWAQNPFRAALDAVRFPNKYPTYPLSKVVQMRNGGDKPTGQAAHDVRPVPPDVAGMPWEPMYRKLKWGEGMEAKDWQVAAVAAGRAGLSTSEAQRINREEGIGAALRWVLGNDRSEAQGVANG